MVTSAVGTLGHCAQRKAVACFQMEQLITDASECNRLCSALRRRESDTALPCCSNNHHCLDTIWDVFNRSVSASGGTAGLELGVASPQFSESTKDIPKALQLVQRSDWTVLAIGSDTSQEGEVRDRLNTSLSDAQKALVKAVLDTNKPVVVIVTSSAGLSIDIVKEMAHSRKNTAVIDAGFLCDNQRALPDTTFGKRNRLGKLAHTIYPESFSLSDLPIPTARECGCNFTAPMSPNQYKICTSCSTGFLNMSWRSFPGVSPGRSYRYYEKTPLWPFGYGLSLTKFTLKPTSSTALALDSATPMETVGELRIAKLTVKNVGPLAGDEVIMAFFSVDRSSLRLPMDSAGATLDVTVPKRQLFAVQRVSLTVGSEAIIEFSYSPESFSLVDEAGTRRVVEGKFFVQFTNGVDLFVNMSVTVNAPSVITTLPNGWNTIRPKIMD
jgi:beta-glucosidase